MAMRNPWPSSATRFSAGTRTLSKWTAAVGWLAQPILRSWPPNERPLVSRSTTKVETPLAPAPPDLAITT